MYFMKNLFQSSPSFTDYYNGYCERLCQILTHLNKDVLTKIADVMWNKISEGKTLFLAGNGGSSSVLSHWVNDLVVGNYVTNCPPIRAINLSDNQAVITALGNDEGYENIFIGQLRAFAKEGDLLIAMSVSGNSPNVIKVVEWAKEHEIKTIGIAGCDGGRMISLCDYGLLVASTKDEYGPVEDVFCIITHIISTFIAQKRGKNLYH
ncbi:MAG: SIS domain-containing protein [Candidatus Hydrogenedens sp.]